MNPPLLPISESAATQFLVVDFHIDNSIVFIVDFQIGND
jgi:hypothetical protein